MVLYRVWSYKRDLRLEQSANTNIIKITKQILLWTFCLGAASLAVAKLTGSLAPDAIEKRLQPMAQVNVVGAQATTTQPGVSTTMTPKDIYDQNCKMCHQTGLAGAPKFGNHADWAPRIAQGLDTLVNAAINGIRAMPPKGNCLKCTPDEIKATVEYMLHAAE